MLPRGKTGAQFGSRACLKSPSVSPSQVSCLPPLGLPRCTPGILREKDKRGGAGPTVLPTHSTDEEMEGRRAYAAQLPSLCLDGIPGHLNVRGWTCAWLFRVSPRKVEWRVPWRVWNDDQGQGPPCSPRSLPAWVALESDNAPAVQGFQAKKHERRGMHCGAQPLLYGLGLLSECNPSTRGEW